MSTVQEGVAPTVDEMLDVLLWGASTTLFEGIVCFKQGKPHPWVPVVKALVTGNSNEIPTQPPSPQGRGNANLRRCARTANKAAGDPNITAPQLLRLGEVLVEIAQRRLPFFAEEIKGPWFYIGKARWGDGDVYKWGYTARANPLVRPGEQIASLQKVVALIPGKQQWDSPTKQQLRLLGGTGVNEFYTLNPLQMLEVFLGIRRSV